MASGLRHLHIEVWRYALCGYGGSAYGARIIAIIKRAVAAVCRVYHPHEMSVQATSVAGYLCAASVVVLDVS